MSKWSGRLRTLGLLLGAVFCFSSLLGIQAQDATEEAGTEGLYIDPSGLFEMPEPAGWEAVLTGPFAAYKHESGAVLSVGAFESDDIEKARTDIITAAAPEIAEAKPTQSTDLPLPNGLWTQDLYLLPDGKVTALISQEKDGVVYFLLLQAPDVTSTQAVSPELNKVLIGFTPGKPVDLTTATAAPLTEENLTDLDSYIAGALEKFEIPGAAVAVVQDGKVIFSKGYGVTSVADGQPVDADTLFMIGSTTKGMTSLIAATLVDEGKLDWDQPATDLLPDFKLSDETATSKIRYRDLLNMTSGVPRYDAPLFLEAADPARIEAMVAEPKLAAQPGEMFNYNNQMVALGGFAAAVAAGGTFGPDIATTYQKLLQERVFDPIGMTRSTLDPKVALADKNHATSYTLDITQKAPYAPIDPSFERFASPVAPAGAVWSSSNDMARYLITQMNLGVTPDGKRIVSEDNLRVTHTAAVEMGSSAYGMGWMIGTWNGLTLMEHGGGTVGFVSDFSYLDEAKLGVVVLANRTGSTFFTAAVREYVYEMAYGLEHTADERYTIANNNTNAAMLQGLQGVELKSVDEAKVADYLGDYSNSTSLVYDDGFYIATAYGRVPLYDFGQENRYLAGGSLVGFGIELAEENGKKVVHVGSLTDQTQSYTITKQ